jgi:hypothetical protein
VRYGYLFAHQTNMDLNNRSKAFSSKWQSKFLTASLLILSLCSVQVSAAQLDCRSVYSSNAVKVGSLENTNAELLRSSQEETKPWFWKIRFADVEKTLEKGRIISVQDLKSALTESGKKPSGTTVGMKLVTFADGTKAIWKPGSKNFTEVAAYRAARAVGSRLVPPTVARKMDASTFDSSVPQQMATELTGLEGSLQYFVQTPYDLLKISGPERVAIWKKVPNSQKAQRDIFNFVFGNWDLHWGNLLIDESNSIVQIDNGAIRSRHKVRYGELPFIRRIGFSLEAKRLLNGIKVGAFPFEDTIYLEKPSLVQVVAAVRNYAEPKALADHIKSRLKSFNAPDLTPDAVERIAEQFAGLIRQKESQDVLEAFARENLKGFIPKDLTMRIAIWENAIWIQAIGFQNYNPITPPVFSEKVLSGYRALTFEKLRSIFPEDAFFTNQALREMLERRDQIMAAAGKSGTVP